MKLDELHVTSNIGVGTTEPIYKLDVHGSANVDILTATSIVGNASSATKLNTARNIGGVSFDGTADIDLPGVNITGNQNTSGSAATLATARTIGGVSFDGSANIDLPGVNAAGNQNTTGSAAKLTTARAINGVDFDGSAAITVTANTHQTLARGAYLTGSNFNGGTATTWDVDADEAATASKIVVRNSSADINCRLVRPNYTDQTSISGAIAYRVNNSNDNYIRFCNSPTAIQTFVNVPSRTGDNASGTWGIDISGNAATATALETARTIGGVSFDGSANIDLPGVNAAGTQNTTGNATTATTATNQSGGTVSATTGSFSGNVGIGTTSPGHTLDVVGSARADYFYGDGSGPGVAATIDSTDDVPEGTTNVYYTDARVDAHLNKDDAVNGQVLTWNGSDYAWVAQSGGGIDTTQTLVLTNATTGLTVDSNVIVGGNVTAQYFVGDGSNLTGVAATIDSTDDVPEGTTNVYYTDARVDAHLNKDDAVNGQVLTWNGSDYAWVAQSGGGGSSSVWSTSGSDIYYSAGNVGIGVTNPGVKLDIAATSGYNPAIRIGTNTTYDDGQLYSLAWGGSALMGMGLYSSTRTVFGSQGLGIHIPNTEEFSVRSNGWAKLFALDGATNKAYFGGNVGIGTTSPKSKLDVYQGANISFGGTTATLADSPGLTLSSSGGKWGLFLNTNSDLIFVGKAGATGSYVGVSGYVLKGNRDVLMNFTGQHRTFIKDVPFTRVENLEGLIVSADNNKYIKMSGGIEVGSNAITMNESLPMVSLSTIANDKKCFGVISQSEDPEKREDKFGNFVTPYQKELGDTRVYINSVGEGAMWVVNTAGPLESGDYITTSNVAGYGQRQDDDILHNYTVAKITMDCDFEPATQPIQIIKKELVNVNYWVSTTYSNVSLEEYSNLTEEDRKTITETVYSNEHGEITIEQYNTLDSNIQSEYSELTRIIYQTISKEESTFEQEGYELEIRQELVNILDEHGQLQWENHPTETEKAYKIRYLTADGQITDEANAVHIAAFVGCTYHCG